MKNPHRLLSYAKNVHSQTGEDGVIERILELIPERDYWCVEFGAWDGQFFSNTRHLIEDQEFNAVLIEGDPVKFNELRDFYCENSRVITMNRLVGWANNQSLDQILAETDIPKDFDFLSIDIDGNDYHVLAALKAYSPKAICIEYNPTIPNEVEFVQKPDFSINQGSSLLSLVSLANSMGYTLVAALPFNAFFVRNEYFQFFNIEDNSQRTLREDISFLTHIFVGYDGTVFLTGLKKLQWHGIPIPDHCVQVLPKYLRTFPDNYSFFQKLFFWVISGFRKSRSRIRSLFASKRVDIHHDSNSDG